MVDLTTFAANPDSDRFEKTMQGPRTAGVKNLYLSNKGIPKAPYYFEYQNAVDFINANNNVEASLYSTYGGSSPAISFVGSWMTSGDQMLTYFELGNEGWI